MHEALIRSLSKYVTLTTEETGIIESLFKPKKYKKHQFILQEGDVQRHEVFVVTGLTRTYHVDEKGHEHVIQFGPEDWWVGDLYSFLTESPSTYNIDCLENTDVLRITKPDLESLYVTVPKMERHFRIILQNAFIATTKRLSGALSKSAAERYEEFLIKYPHIDQRVPNHQVASYLGVTPQSLSRIRAQGVRGGRREA